MADMNWFSGNAAKFGNLVYFMNQSWTDPLAQDGPWGDVSGGYCAGLTVRWIRLAYAGKDFVGKPGWTIGGQAAPWFNGTDYQAVIYQNKLIQYFKATLPSGKLQSQYALGLGQMLLAADLLEEASAQVTGAKLYRIAKQSYGCFYIGLAGQKGAHALALRHARPPSGKGPGVLHIFDANYGHFAWQVASSSWTQILDSYLHYSGYGKKYSTYYVIGRATPPIY
jgi:hypothetical protein